MRREFSALVYLVPLLTVVLAFYQNCGSGFGSSAKSQENQSLSISNNLKLIVEDEAGQAVTSDHLEPHKSYSLRIDEVKMEFSEASSTYTWELEQSVAGACHFHKNLSAPEQELECHEETDLLRITLRVAAGSKENSGVLQVKVAAPSAATPTPSPLPSSTPSPNIVEFRILSGTGNGSWNTLATAVRVFVGQTLRIINDDTVNHRLHTPGRPCAHQPTNSTPGQAFDCVISGEVMASAGSLYDHLAGVNAKFYVNAYNGNQLYTDRCLSCHGPLATSTKKGRTAAQIRSATLSVSEMTTIKLTDDQFAAIAFALRN